MNPAERCPRFDTCNAALCPADPRWPSACHVKGEAVCRYLLGTAKRGAAAHYGADPQYRIALAVVGPVGERFPAIARAVALAARSGFPGGNAKNLRKRPAVASGGDCARGEGGSDETWSHPPDGTRA
jgi:hypothetical protein